MNRLICLMALLCIYLNGLGQSLQSLSTGDTVPDFTLNNIINYKSSTAKLSDFKNKLLVLDFWATWCGSCLKSFPEIYKLQEKFRDKAQILLVNSRSTKDSNEKIQKFIAQRKAAYSFPTLVSDTLFSNLFSHSYIPYYVWLYNNKVCAITDEGSVTEENIKQALSGDFANINQIKNITYDFRQPLFQNDNGGVTPNYLYQSFLTPYVPGLKSTRSKGQNKDRQIIRITFTNSSTYDLYSYAFPTFSGLTTARILLEIKDSVGFYNKNPTSAWNHKNLYCYQALFPPCTEENALKIMQNDLHRYYGYKVISTEKVMNCWILKAQSNTKAVVFPKGMKHETNLFENSGLPIYFNNYQLSPLLRELESIYMQPFLDETQIKVPVTITLPADLHNILALKKSLAEQGLLLTYETRKIRVIILSDNQ